jgi:hypothetical protein
VDGTEHEQVRYFQRSKGRLPLSPVDTDARWRTSRAGKQPSGPNYLESLIVELGGFIVAKGVTHSPDGERKTVPYLLDHLPIEPVSLAGDTGYYVGQLR